MRILPFFLDCSYHAEFHLKSIQIFVIVSTAGFLFVCDTGRYHAMMFTPEKFFSLRIFKSSCFLSVYGYTLIFIKLAEWAFVFMPPNWTISLGFPFSDCPRSTLPYAEVVPLPILESSVDSWLIPNRLLTSLVATVDIALLVFWFALKVSGRDPQQFPNLEDRRQSYQW